MKRIVTLLLSFNLIYANAETSTSWINPCNKNNENKQCNSIQNGIDNLIHQINYLHATKILLKYNGVNKTIAQQTKKSVIKECNQCEITLELNNNTNYGVEAILNY
ncbi:MAG: hypothetical protein K2X04_07230 [Burkholderiales bacterium]|nr:hypothetical protein [Burkholderiales bacterium]